jgi:hypothetical protein
VIEPNLDVAPKATSACDREYLPDAQVTPMNIYDQTSESEIEKQSGFMRETDQRF